MNNKFFTIFCIVFFAVLHAFAQPASPGLKTMKIAIFSPMYLDSVFENGNYKYGKNFPKFVQPGLDFVQGALIALDSMPLPNGNIKAEIFDSKAGVQNINWLLANHKLDSMDLIIGAVKDAEFTQLAAIAKQRNIPFVSAILPNDGGVTANPFLIITNATLRAHCETIYAYLLQNHGADKILFCRKKGQQEDKIADYFKAINEPDGKPLINIQTVNFEDDFDVLKNKLDSSKKNIIVGASLNEDFAAGLVSTAFDLKDDYKTEIIGMPNWDGFSELKKSTADYPVYYTAAYMNAKTDEYSKKVQKAYLKKYRGAPTDMAYKGFETVFIFARLISRYPDDFTSHLNDYAYKVFSDYNFKPVYLSRKNTTPDYFENKHLYFMKILNGKISKSW